MNLRNEREQLPAHLVKLGASREWVTQSVSELDAFVFDANAPRQTVSRGIDRNLEGLNTVWLEAVPKDGPAWAAYMTLCMFVMYSRSYEPNDRMVRCAALGAAATLIPNSLDVSYLQAMFCFLSTVRGALFMGGLELSTYCSLAVLTERYLTAWSNACEVTMAPAFTEQAVRSFCSTLTIRLKRSRGYSTDRAEAEREDRMTEYLIERTCRQLRRE